MKKGKLIGLAIVGVLVFAGINACSSSSGVSTGDGIQTQQETQVPKNTLKKSFNRFPKEVSLFKRVKGVAQR